MYTEKLCHGKNIFISGRKQVIWPDTVSEEVTFDLDLIRQYFELVKTQVLEDELYFLLVM